MLHMILSPLKLAGAFGLSLLLGADHPQGRASPLPIPRAPLPLAEVAASLPPLAPPAHPMAVYHLGHSLVGRDMPLFLAALAGHDHASQLGWGTSLREHWEEALPINGFEAENAHPHFRPAREALASGTYDALVLTEMVDLQDAITYHGSPRYLQLWAEAARKARPDLRIYLYESWHSLDLGADWLARLEGDLARLWLGELLQGAAAWGARGIYLIPAGQALAQAVRAAESGQLPPLKGRTDFFRRAADGSQDPIHPSDYGNLLVALTHHAVLYHRAPTELPQAYPREDGSTFTPDPAVLQRLSMIALEVARSTPLTGLSP